MGAKLGDEFAWWVQDEASALIYQNNSVFLTIHPVRSSLPVIRPETKGNIDTQ